MVRIWVRRVGVGVLWDQEGEVTLSEYLAKTVYVLEGGKEMREGERELHEEMK